jgi:hypothetical protein
MNKEQFIFWLKGFTKAVNEHAPTPKQWETIVSELDKIKDCPDYGSPIGEGGWGVPNLAPIQTLPFIQPYNPYIVTCEGNTTLTVSSGSSGTYTIPSNQNISFGTITTTPGQSSITYATPQFVTSTAYGYPSGSAWHYTNTLPQQPTTGSNQLELDLE